MKLQKLCYYARAWTLVWDDAPLFEEDFQAWANGLVCPNCFLRHRVSTL
nr:type II toxin-antitoxin system antitoxin SocA domain-containing protein [uncultured Acetatifactor sp.]